MHIIKICIKSFPNLKSFPQNTIYYTQKVKNPSDNYLHIISAFIK
jgi:hypothetical protein